MRREDPPQQDSSALLPFVIVPENAINTDVSGTPERLRGQVMKRRTLDLIFSTGGLVLAGLVLVLALILQNQANFAKSYVHDQLSKQAITFTPAKGLKPNENAACLKANAGKPLTTGKQAECYANHYIAVHLSEVNDGKTYAQTSNEARAITDTSSPAYKALDAKVQTLFRGETLRGLLLTSYGFSIFGERAAQAAWVCYLVALVLFLAAIAGFIHAATRKADHLILEPAHEERVPVNA